MELEDSPAGLIESSSSNDLAETEPAESVQGLEVDEEGYQSCDSEAGLEVDVEMATEDGNLGIGEVPDEELPLQVEGGDMPETQGSEDPLQWQPGRNCGSYISKFSPVTEQALVFIGNAYTNLSALPCDLLRKLASYLPKRQRSTRCSWRMAVLSEMFAVSHQSIRSWITELQANQWKPRGRQSVVAWKKKNAAEKELALGEADAQVQRSLPNDARQILRNLVSRVLFSCCEGQTGLGYERDIANLLEIVGPQYFGHQHHSCKFFLQVIYMGARVLEKLEAARINEPLGGIGIVSDVGVLLDPVSLGLGSMARHETVLVTCLALVGSRGRLFTPFLCAPTIPLQGHTGDAPCNLALSGLGEHACGLSMFSLKKRLAVVSGDGALCQGGPDSVHSSTKACEKIWSATHPSIEASCTTWDRFHRLDSAVWRAVLEVKATEEVFDLAAAMDSLFGMNEGKMLLRGIGALMNQAPRSTRRAGGTRKVAYLSGVPSNLLQNLKHYVLGLHARLAWKRLGALVYCKSCKRLCSKF